MAINVDGLRQVVRTLERLGTEVADLKGAFKKIGDMVARDAVQITPTVSGALANSIRAANQKNRAVVRAGSAKIPYAGVQHFGNYNNITGTHFLTKAAKDNEGEALRMMEEDLNALIRQLGLN